MGSTLLSFPLLSKLGQIEQALLAGLNEFLQRFGERDVIGFLQIVGRINGLPVRGKNAPLAEAFMAV